MATDQKYQDPVDKGKAQKDRADVKAQEEKLSFSRLKLADFKAVPRRAAQIPHPFEGYPERMMQAGTYTVDNTNTLHADPNEIGKEKPLMINATHVVALSPSLGVEQDPSGRNIMVGDPAKGTEKMVTIHTSHNRVVSYGGMSFDAVFDRILELEDGQKVRYCLVPDPVYRAQIIFFWNAAKGSDGAIDTRPDYLLLDSGQVGRLRQVFQMIINPRLKIERVARAISGESEESLDDLKGVETPQEAE